MVYEVGRIAQLIFWGSVEAGKYRTRARSNQLFVPRNGGRERMDVLFVMMSVGLFFELRSIVR